MSMIVDKENKKMTISIPNSEAAIPMQLKCMKDSEVTGYYTNDKELQKKDIVDFLQKDLDYILDIRATILMLENISKNIYSKYNHFYKGNMSELNNVLEYFKSIGKEYVKIPKMFFSGSSERYLKFENDDPIIKKLRTVLYGDITSFAIIDYNSEYYMIRPFLKEDYQSILEKRREKIEMQDKDIYEKFIAFHEKYKFEYLENNDKDLEKEFIEKYPINKINELELKDYALGTENFKESLSYNLEFGKYKDLCASVKGGTANKYGIYLSTNDEGQTTWKAGLKSTKEPEEYWSSLREQLSNALIESNSGNVYEYSSKYPLLKGMSQIILKLAFIYDKNNNFIGILSKKYLVDICKIFGLYDKEAKKMSSEELNHKLAKFLYSKFEFLKECDRSYVSSLIWKFMEYMNGQVDEIIESNKFLYPEIFISDEYINKIFDVLKRKKNIVLQGSPGVGKTFIATNLLGTENDFETPELVQFHQSYSYEDFVQGYRPNKDGKFDLQNGVFYNLVKEAIDHEDKNYCIIIDEINRGNLSKIFGELMLLIECDKRKQKYEVSLTYSNEKEKFYIPSNLYIIGTMNTADRSLAMVDYALRRRFAFIDIEPGFNTEKFKEYMIEKESIDEEFLNKVIDKMTTLNFMIESSLGKGFEIGHSYFVGTLNIDNLAESYNQIVEYEIKPLLEEYWFDDDIKVEEALAIIAM